MHFSTSSRVAAMKFLPAGSIFLLAICALIGTGQPVRAATYHDGADLQRELFALEKSGGGTLRLPDATTLTCQVLQADYKGGHSAHALLIPERVTLDLNGGT